MKKPILMAIIAFFVLLLALAYPFYQGMIWGQEGGVQDSLEIDTWDKFNFSEIGTCVNDSCLKDQEYLKQAINTGNLTPCNNISDPDLKKKCRPAVLEKSTGGAGGEQSDGGSRLGGPQENEDSPEIIRLVNLISSYKCGSEICFQLKAHQNNTDSVDVSETEYLLNEVLVQAESWDGLVDGPSCIDEEVLEPGQTCFGKIPNSTCLLGDVFQASFEPGAVSWMELGECD
jgi:hypothetical protein